MVFLTICIRKALTWRPPNNNINLSVSAYNISIIGSTYVALHFDTSMILFICLGIHRYNLRSKKTMKSSF